jgi:tetratricopeptide (TPR) repeat protein
MKIIRWLLSHTVLILLIVAVIYAYMFWGNLAGDDTPAGKALAYLSSEFDEVGEFVAAVKAKQEQLSQHGSTEINPSEVHEPSSMNAVPAVAASLDSSRRIQSAEAQVAEAQAVEKNNFTAPGDVYSSENSNENRNAYSSDYRSLEQQPASHYSQNQATVKSEASAIIVATTEPVDDAILTNSQSKSTASKTQSATEGEIKDTFVSAQVEKQLDNVDREGRLLDDSLKPDSRQDDNKQGDDIRENWIAARESFYLRKYDLSEQSYQKVIDSTEDNVDAYGELGNVYFNQGKKEQAASAYFEAAAILVRQGQVDRARSLMGLLRHLDKSKAGELQKLIDSAAS